MTWSAPSRSSSRKPRLASWWPWPSRGRRPGFLTRRAQRAELLQARGFAFQPEQTAAISVIDLASKGQVAGLTLGRMLSLLFMFFMLVGGAVVATDLLAGEKERGTLETLLTTAASRAEIVLAKHLVILTVALLINLDAG